MDAESRKIARQERYRRHRRGDHSQCLPDRGCPAPPAASPARADRVRAAVLAQGASPAREALADELARTLVRLDVLDRALVDVPLDATLLREARQQAVTAARLIAALDRSATTVAPQPIRNPLEQLRARRLARVAQPGGTA